MLRTPAIAINNLYLECDEMAKCARKALSTAIKGFESRDKDDILDALEYESDVNRYQKTSCIIFKTYLPHLCPKVTGILWTPSLIPSATSSESAIMPKTSLSLPNSVLIEIFSLINKL
jgi:hypothetical protein